MVSISSDAIHHYVHRRVLSTRYLPRMYHFERPPAAAGPQALVLFI